MKIFFGKKYSVYCSSQNTLWLSLLFLAHFFLCQGQNKRRGPLFHLLGIFLLWDSVISNSVPFTATHCQHTKSLSTSLCLLILVSFTCFPKYLFIYFHFNKRKPSFSVTTYNFLWFFCTFFTHKPNLLFLFLNLAFRRFKRFKFCFCH